MPYVSNVTAEYTLYAYDTSLDFSDPKATHQDLLIWLERMPQLERLNIQHPEWETIPEQIAACTKLVSLRLDIPKLKSFPASGFELLQNLYISAQSAPLLPALPKLTQLELKVSEFKTSGKLAMPLLSALHIECGTFSTWDIPEESLQMLWNLDVVAPLKELPDFSASKNLSRLKLDTHISDFSVTGKLPAGLTFLELKTSARLTKPLAYSELPNLEQLNVFTPATSSFLNGISRCKELDVLYIFGLEKLPEELAACKNLRVLLLDGGDIQTLPEWITTFSALYNLVIRNTSIDKVPADWSALKLLYNLVLSNNKITSGTFLTTLSGEPSITFDEKNISDPLFLLETGKTLVLQNYHPIPLEYPDKSGLFPLVAALARTAFSREEKEWFFTTIRDQKLESVSDWSVNKAAQALCISWKPLQDKVYKRFEKELKAPDSIAHEVLFLDGTFSEKKTLLKTKIKELQAELTSKPEEATILVLGKNPTSSYTIGESTTRILESQLYQILKAVPESPEKFLLQEEGEDDSLLDGLKSLLASEDSSNVLIGLSTLKSGGVPEGMLDYLLYVQKSNPDAKVRSEARTLLELNGPTRWFSLLRDKQVFKNSDKEKDIRGKLEKLEKSAAEEELVELAFILQNFSGKGLSFVLAKKNSNVRIEALRRLTNNGVLDFHKGIGYRNWKEAKPEDVIVSAVKTKIAFPSDHPEPLSIEKLNFHNCKFETLSKDIKVFSNVREIDLSVNGLKSLPLELKKLEKLEILDLSFNKFSEIPGCLFEMKNLKKLNLKYNGNDPFRNDTTTTILGLDELKKQLPSCEILS